MQAQQTLSLLLLIVFVSAKNCSRNKLSRHLLAYSTPNMVGLIFFLLQRVSHVRIMQLQRIQT